MYDTIEHYNIVQYFNLKKQLSANGIKYFVFTDVFTKTRINKSQLL